MRTFIIFFLFCFFGISTDAQFLKTSNAYISFYSKAPLEDIEAHNYNVDCVLDTVKNQIAFSARIIDFNFDKKLMKKHFCEKYMEIDDFPFASFSGQLDFINQTNAKVTGELEIHGQKNKVEVNAYIEKKSNDKIVMKSSFFINLSDYKVKIPKIVKDNISKSVEINVIVSF